MKTTDNICVGCLLGLLSSIRTAHWNADTATNDHEALGKLYEALDGLVDDFVETYIGKFGGKASLEELDLESTTDYSSLIEAGCNIVEKFRAELETGADDDLLNILADIEGALNHAKYLLKASGKKTVDQILASRGAQPGNKNAAGPHKSRISEDEAFRIYNKHVGPSSSGEMSKELSQVENPTHEDAHRIALKHWGPSISGEMRNSFKEYFSKTKASQPMKTIDQILGTSQPSPVASILGDARGFKPYVRATWSPQAREAAAEARKLREGLGHDPHEVAKKISSGFSSSRVRKNEDGSATIRVRTPDQHEKYPMSATIADKHLETAGGLHNISTEELSSGHHQQIGHLHFNVKKVQGGHDVHISHASDSTPDDQTITARATADLIFCRAATSLNTASDRPWKQGQETEFMYMPAGQHTICAGFRGKSILLTVEVDPERDTQTVQASFQKLCERYPKQKPFGCIEHEEKDASVWAKGFSPKADGIYLAAEPSALGESHVNGRIHRSWSPSFLTDADYSKASLKNDVYEFPDGVRGSETNPARITGIAFCVGTLTNNPAFKEMNPVRAREMSVVSAGAAPGNKNAAGPHRRNAQISAGKAWEAHQAKSPDEASKAAYDTTREAVKAENIARASGGRQDLLDAANAHSSAEEAHQAAHECSGHEHHRMLKEAHNVKAEELYTLSKAAVKASDHSIKASGTSEGVKKGWDARRSQAWAATEKAAKLSSEAYGDPSNERHEAAKNAHAEAATAHNELATLHEPGTSKFETHDSNARAHEKMAAEHENLQISEGDDVHLGFGARGGAGFRGKLTKVEGQTAHVRNSEGRDFSGPMKHLTKACDLSSDDTVQATWSPEAREAAALAKKAKSHEGPGNADHVKALKHAMGASKIAEALSDKAFTSNKKSDHLEAMAAHDSAKEAHRSAEKAGAGFGHHVPHHEKSANLHHGIAHGHDTRYGKVKASTPAPPTPSTILARLSKTGRPTPATNK